MTAGSRLSVARVTAVLHPSDRHEALLELASRLAESFGAELAGQFIRDADFLNMAALPFTRLVSFPSGTISALQVEMMERALGAEAEAAEKALSALAASRRLAWSYRVVSLTAAAALSATCGEPGLVVASLDGGMGRKEWLQRADALLKSRWSAGALLLLRPGRPVSGPVVTFSSPEALAYGARLAEIFAGGLVVLARGEAEEKSARDWLAGNPVERIRIETFDGGGEAAAIERAAPGVLVVGRRRVSALADVLRKADTHLLIVENG